MQLEDFKEKHAEAVIDVGLAAVHYTDHARGIGLHARYDRMIDDALEQALDLLDQSVDAVKAALG